MPSYHCGYYLSSIVSSANLCMLLTSTSSRHLIDSVDRSALWKALRSTSVPPFLVHLIQDLHLGSKSRVRINNRLSDPFTTTSGVRQGCVLAPALFCIAIDWITSRCVGTMGVSVGNTTFTDQDCADDAVLFTDGVCFGACDQGSVVVDHVLCVWVHSWRLMWGLRYYALYLSVTTWVTTWQKKNFNNNCRIVI